MVKFQTILTTSSPHCRRLSEYVIIRHTSMELLEHRGKQTSASLDPGLENIQLTSTLVRGYQVFAGRPEV
jgi:hypothetical protein